MKKLWLIVTAMLCMLFVCCGKEDVKAGEKVVVISGGSKPKTLDPYMYNSIPDLAISRQCYDSLFRREVDGEILPNLVEEFKFETPTELRLVLKEGIKFQDGSPLTVEDVLFSFDRMKKMPASALMVSDIEKVEALDDKTIVLHMYQSSAPILFCLAHPLTSIVNKKFVEANDGNISTAAMGTGAFKFVAWGEGEKIQMEAFPDYFRGAPKIDKLIFRAIGEDSSRLAALETGEIDIAYNMSAVDTPTIKEDKNLELISDATTAVEYLCLNMEKAPFNNEDFRKALNYAVNRQSIIDSVYSGRGKVVNSIVSPNVFGYYDALAKMEYNTVKAKEYLKKSGIQNPSFTLYINEGVERNQAGQIMQANLKELGIEMKIETLEWGTYLQKTAEGQFQAFLGGWISGTADADLVLYPLLDSKCIGSAGNRSRYNNPVYDKLVEDARSELNVEKRKELYKEAQLILEEECPLIILYAKNQNIGVNKRVKGFKYDPTNMHSLYSLEIQE